MSEFLMDDGSFRMIDWLLTTFLRWSAGVYLAVGMFGDKAEATRRYALSAALFALATWSPR